MVMMGVETGNPEVDEQHRALLAMADEIMRLTSSMSGAAEVRGKFNSMMAELDAHFATEENHSLSTLPKKMQEIERNEHKRLVRQLNRLMEKYEADVRDRRGRCLHRSLRELLIKHIQDYDLVLMGQEEGPQRHRQLL